MIIYTDYLNRFSVLDIKSTTFGISFDERIRKY